MDQPGRGYTGQSGSSGCLVFPRRPASLPGVGMCGPAVCLDEEDHGGFCYIIIVITFVPSPYLILEIYLGMSSLKSTPPSQVPYLPIDTHLPRVTFLRKFRTVITDYSPYQKEVFGFFFFLSHLI